MTNVLDVVRTKNAAAVLALAIAIIGVTAVPAISRRRSPTGQGVTIYEVSDGLIINDETH